MPIKISRLRFWFGLGAIIVTAVVAGAYLYAKWRVENALKEVPGKIGIEVQQSAQGFTVSRSEGGHTLFKIQASKAIKYKLGGRVELHNVNIIVYGKDSNRFDQIYGNDFSYDPQSQDVTALGEVQIDLEANPGGLNSPDQAPPKELKNPIHLETSGLVFNQKTGDAHTANPIEFRIPQASGTAVGVEYIAKTGVLTLESQVKIAFSGPNAATVNAEKAFISKNPRTIVFERPRVETASGLLQSGEATLFLRVNNTVDRALATGRVDFRASGARQGQVRAAQLEIFLSDENNLLRNAVFSGGVHVEASAPQAVIGDASRVALDFAGKNVLNTVHAEGNVKILEKQKPSSSSAIAQNVEVTAPAIDFLVADGRRLAQASTSGSPQIAIDQAAGQRTVVSAGKLVAGFDTAGQLTSLHGAPNARIVGSGPNQDDRVSTSNMLDVNFLPGEGIRSITQQGNVAYADSERKAWADRATYTPANQILMLAGSPRLADDSMTTTARAMRLNRATGDALAEGDVKTTYSNLKEQPGGALLAAASPIHVTAQKMTAKSSPEVAIYSGDARLWQDANVVQAATIEFDRERRQMLAKGSSTSPVSTVLVETSNNGKVAPVTITSPRLSYADDERTIHLEGGVKAEGADVELTADKMDVFLQPRQNDGEKQSAAPVGKIEKIVAQGEVVVTQPGRKATGGELNYTAADDKFVMAGNSPSIFDAEHGKITGVSLTFFRHDDRVLVEGDKESPAVTRARVAR